MSRKKVVAATFALFGAAAIAGPILLGIEECGSCNPTNPADGKTMAILDNLGRDASSRLTRHHFGAVYNYNEEEWGLFRFNQMASHWDMVMAGSEKDAIEEVFADEYHNLPDDHDGSGDDRSSNDGSGGDYGSGGSGGGTGGYVGRLHPGVGTPPGAGGSSSCEFDDDGTMQCELT